MGELQASAFAVGDRLTVRLTDRPPLPYRVDVVELDVLGEYATLRWCADKHEERVALSHIQVQRREESAADQPRRRPRVDNVAAVPAAARTLAVDGFAPVSAADLAGPEPARKVDHAKLAAGDRGDDE